MSELHLRDIASVLRSYQGDFVALDVFAKDVAELKGQVAVFTALSSDRFKTVADDVELEVQFFEAKNVARFTLAQPNTELVGTALGAAAGAMVAQALDDHRESPMGLIFGLLLGGMLGAKFGKSVADSRAPRQVLTIRYDPAVGQWKAYHGPYLSWAKEALRAE